MIIKSKHQLFKWLRVGISRESYRLYFTGKDAEWADMPCKVVPRGKTPRYEFDTDEVLAYFDKKYGSDEFDIWGLLELAGKHRPF